MADAQQATLFDVAAPASFTPHVYLPAQPRATQVAAAARALPRSGTQRRRVYDQIVRAGQDGLTDEEIGAFLRLSLNSVRPRRLELVEAGLVADSSRRRDTQGKNPAIVWIANER